MGCVAILTPSYRGVQDQTRLTLMELIRKTQCLCGTHNPWECPNGKQDIIWLPPLGSSVIHWTRNQVVAVALYGGVDTSRGRPLFDHFLLVDDDMVTEPHYLDQLLRHKKDIVAGVCTVRRDPPKPNIRNWFESEGCFREPISWDWDSLKLMEVGAIGAAFVLVKRRVLERMAEAYLDCEFEIAEDVRKGYNAEHVNAYWSRRAARRRERFDNADEWQKKDCWWFQFLDNVDDRQHGEMGEDLSFCWKAKRLGFRIFADPQVLPGHLGLYAYSIPDYRHFIETARENSDQLDERPVVTDEIAPMSAPSEEEIHAT